MTISDERVERAAKAMWEFSHPNPPGWIVWKDTDFGPSILERKLTLSQARATLEADAPAIAEAEARGRLEGMKEARQLVGEWAWKHMGEDAYSRGMDAGAIHQAKYFADAFDARIAALQSPNKTEGT